MNVDRMRRYVARTTPDEISREFSWEEIDNNEHIRWQDQFRKRMRIKHSRVHGEIIALVEQEFFERKRWVITMKFKEIHPPTLEELHGRDIISAHEWRKENGFG